MPGVGDKTAAGIISRYGIGRGRCWPRSTSRRSRGLSPSVRAKLVAARDYLVAARPVVDVVCDLPVPAHLDDLLPREPADPEALVELSTRWGLDSPLNRLLTVLRQPLAAP